MAGGKPRAIIANLYSRPLRNQLLRDARPLNTDTDIPVYFAEDMIKSDHLA